MTENVQLCLNGESMMHIISSNQGSRVNQGIISVILFDTLAVIMSKSITESYIS